MQLFKGSKGAGKTGKRWGVMDTGINENDLPDSLVLHDPITGEPIQKQYDESSIVLDPLTEKQIADQERLYQNRQMQKWQQTYGKYYDYPAAKNSADNHEVPMESGYKILCFLSLLGFMISRFGGFGLLTSLGFFGVLNIIMVPLLLWFVGVIGFILMIVARVKNKKSIFGKIVMWLYIIDFVLKGLFVLLIVLETSGFFWLF
ncbi:hypothetical protein SAMN02910276_01591 [Butyrivibrio sp. Su6]|nr:hypothetical protein SAMN02910276_01591 [Butyrivibrio sp. Su6]